MKILYLILTLSILINLLVLMVDTIPFIWPKIKRKLLKDKPTQQIIDNQELEMSLVKRADEMIQSDKIFTIWSEQKSFTETVFNFLRKGKQYNLRAYHYPRAYLYYGLSEYYKKTSEIDGQNKLKHRFDKIINDDGDPCFNLNLVDQVPFGLTALNLYTIYKEEKYKLFYEKVFNFLVECQNDDGAILYRQGPNINIQFYDLIGMIVPFLVEYYKHTSNSNALQIAKTQLDYYIKYGVDKETFIPAHGIDMRSNIKIGSINWGRGIGWYLLGLSAYHSVTGEYGQELNGIYLSLNKTRTSDNLFTQFPGSSRIVDSSTSTMFLYSFSFLKDSKKRKNEILDLFASYIDKKGRVLNTSGDTYGLNSYSESFGYSELSQGMLLLLLSRAEK